MSKQSGPCAFTNACGMPGPRARLAGTNRTFCLPHFRVVKQATFSTSASSLATMQSLAGGRRGAESWATYTGVIGKK